MNHGLEILKFASLKSDYKIFNMSIGLDINKSRNFLLLLVIEVFTKKYRFWTKVRKRFIINNHGLKAVVIKRPEKLGFSTKFFFINHS